MRKSKIFLAILLSGIATNVSAQGQFDLLQIPALTA